MLISVLDGRLLYCYHHLLFSISVISQLLLFVLSLVVGKTGFFAYAKTKTQISFATAKLISAFVFATRIVQSLYFLNPKFQTSSNRLWLYRQVCVEPGQKPRKPVFSQRGSFSLTWVQNYNASFKLRSENSMHETCVQSITEIPIIVFITGA